MLTLLSLKALLAGLGGEAAIDSGHDVFTAAASSVGTSSSGDRREKVKSSWPSDGAGFSASRSASFRFAPVRSIVFEASGSFFAGDKAKMEDRRISNFDGPSFLFRLVSTLARSSSSSDFLSASFVSEVDGPRSAL
jgi:hypothetical protein